MSGPDYDRGYHVRELVQSLTLAWLERNHRTQDSLTGKELIRRRAHRPDALIEQVRTEGLEIALEVIAGLAAERANELVAVHGLDAARTMLEQEILGSITDQETP
jgi:hypothetical protein